mmetsp:Transcript_58369/g.92764  ORF Transcript_58369/g.92764 Transcript_58369/m.92764 type:complete len:217 (+) Transcript_58369:645-1295(+)
MLAHRTAVHLIRSVQRIHSLHSIDARRIGRHRQMIDAIQRRRDQVAFFAFPLLLLLRIHFDFLLFRHQLRMVCTRCFLQPLLVVIYNHMQMRVNQLRFILVKFRDLSRHQHLVINVLVVDMVIVVEDAQRARLLREVGGCGLHRDLVFDHAVAQFAVHFRQVSLVLLVFVTLSAEYHQQHGDATKCETNATSHGGQHLQAFGGCFGGLFDCAIRLW